MVWLFRMPYTEAMSLEVFRYSCINPIAARSPKEDASVNGYFVPKVSN